jgi:hypothetical protein
MFNVSVSFPLDDDFAEKTQLVEDELGKCENTGAGFGMRDLVYEVETEEMAQQMVAEALEIDIPGLEAEYYPG